MAEINRRRGLVLDFLRLLDGCLIVLGAVLASKIRFDVWLPPADLWVSVALVPAIYLTYLQLVDGYRYFLPAKVKVGITSLLSGVGVAFGLLLVGAFFAKSSTEFSRLWTGYWALLTLVLLIVGRLSLMVWLRNTRQAALMVPQAVVLIGDSKGAVSLINYFSEESEKISLKIRGVFQFVTSQTTPFEGTRPAGKALEALIDYIRKNPVDYLFLALNEVEHERLGSLLEKLEELSISILDAPIDGQLNLCQQEKGHDWIIHAGLPFRRMSFQPFGPRGWWLKVVEDYVLGSLCLILVAPVMVLIAIAIKLSSPGPVFFKQKRHGFNGEEIWVYKFRSMIDGRREEPEVPQATKDDPRVTRLGRFLRQSSLDELPQLINVLKGEMSLVGPRPHAVEHNRIYEKKIVEYLARHRVKPGITGWAQVNGWRGETDTDEKMGERVRHDLYYINHWSPFFDMRILFMTLFVVFMNKNAY
jgi:putative colanic acid biosynthesis UDP-glucose lipid carrier transferase